MKLLIIEDDPRLARFLTRVLREEGYVADLCATGEDGIRQALTGIYDVVLLDWMLPDFDGLTVCREVRRAGLATPVLMLTARGETRERVMGLDAGADDYLIKPFEIDELLARIRALLRRSATVTEIAVHDLVIDRLARQASVDGMAIDLTAREFSLLLYLAQRPGRVVPKSELLAQVWDLKFDPGTKVVEVHVSRLRAKLGANGWMIETMRGIGYCFRKERPA